MSGRESSCLEFDVLRGRGQEAASPTPGRWGNAGGTRPLGRVYAAAAAALVLAASAFAQREPHLGYVYPAGGQRGTSFGVTVAGQSLGGVATARVSGRGVRAEVKGYERPLNQREVDALREKAAELTRRRQASLAPPARGGAGGVRPAWTEADEKELLSIRTRLANRTRREATPAIAEIVTLGVTIAKDAEPGRHELRLFTPSGGTNPLVFCVGDLPEAHEASEAGGLPANPRAAARDAAPRPEPETRLTLPTVVNGQILPGDVDRFRFAARRGQRLVVAASARALIPYLADAVPGWFQAIVTLRDASGVELACADDWRFDPDPVLLYEVPADGDYVLELRDALYRGREDFVYRLALGELPFLSGLFPLGGPRGQATRVALQGWNLPVREVTVPAAAAAVPATLHLAELPDRALPFVRDTLDEHLEAEPNDAPQTAQRVGLPCLVNGRIGRPGDADVFCFEGRSGQVFVAEVQARRLQSPVDAVLRLVDAGGRQIAFGDDGEDLGDGLTTHHADASLQATLPADGSYYLQVTDAQRQGGEAHGYRLRLGPPRPDFELRVFPSGINARAGAVVPITVHAVRRDGFDGEIVLGLADALPGLVLGGGRIPAGTSRVRCTLGVPAGRGPGAPVALRLLGQARIGGRDVRHEAVACEDAMQAFLYKHLVGASELLLAVSGRGASPGVRVEHEGPVRIPAGGTASVHLAAPRQGGGESVLLELDDPPAGIAIERLVAEPRGQTLVLRADPSLAKPGVAGNLIVRAVAAGAPAAAPNAARPPARRRLLGFLPAIPFEVVPPTGGSDGLR